jgi:CBS domain containing-hemolysin-like protein
MSLSLLIVFEVIALFLQGLFSGSEIALLNCDRMILKQKSDKGDYGARLALQILSKPERLLSTTLIGTNIMVVLQATLVTLFIYKNTNHENSFIASLLLTPFTLIFGEIIPKVCFQAFAENITPWLSRFIYIAQLFFSPIIFILNKYTTKISLLLKPIQKFFNIEVKHSFRDELKFLLTASRGETNLDHFERKVISKILDFSNALAKKAIIPLVEIDAVEDTCTQEEVMDFFIKTEHSRLPVYHERIDNIIGIIHVFDLFSETDRSKPITSIMRPAFYAPETQSLDDLLYTMRKRGIPMSIIVDEYGGAVGLITVEDILEQVVGDIQDEFDEEEPSEFRILPDGSFLIQARMKIDEINEKLKLDLPKGNYETLSGFLLTQFGCIPSQNDELYILNKKFTIKKATARTIELVHIEVLES